MAVQTYSYAQLEPGFSGYYKDTVDPTLKRFDSNAVLMFSVVGTDASIKVGGGGSDPYKVIVDNGAPVQPTIVGGEIELFSGLSDTLHVVSIFSAQAYVIDWNWMSTSEAELLTVTGAVPALTILPVEFVTWDAFLGVSTQPEVAAPGGDTTPIGEPQVIPTTPARGQIIFNAQCEEIYVYTGQEDVRYSINDGAMITVTASANTERRMILLSDAFDNSQVHKYSIWDGEFNAWPNQGVCIVNNDLPVSAQAPPTGVTIGQFGDSITYGDGAIPGDVDIYMTGVKTNSPAIKTGVSGQNTAGLTAALPGYLIEVPMPDYPIIASGRNDIGNGSLQAQYTACIQEFLDNGATYVLCRGILPEGAQLWPTENGAIAAAVASFSDPKIIFMDMATCPYIQTDLPDTTHPDLVGYVTIEGFITPIIAEIIAQVISASVVYYANFLQEGN